MDDLPFNLGTLEPGWVWLVGAGPGDPGLLTLHAMAGLQQADIVVYDALVNEQVLQLARTGAALVYAGKRGGKPSAAQPDICDRLIAEARAGRRVLRLKGGDPFVFGRGGEEAETLVDAGVPFRIVPGITAGVGGLAYAGIPATHRDVNSVITFLTGHNSDGVVPDAIDWPAVARSSPVLVLYMALKHLAPIRERLLAAGRRGDEAMALISQASLPSQAVLETTLDRCVADVAGSRIAPPAIAVLGASVAMRGKLLSLARATAGADDAIGARPAPDADTPV